ncbi:DUF308 domain-containing protein [Dyadobacter subterraneus]|uniref:DUF308 domain-containing protein n=1 Tax=Dyadobacter subterraneus TaxID=2773304 RepID=A0ABR9WDP4_9BACT|nr:DUF308 domain-containing protein [Dyadobacter subterraneus]MBE9463617.1 hypothetical protein [Dyadobacter subterraneus]
MSSSSSFQESADSQSVETARALRRLYFMRAAFSVCWAILIGLFSAKSAGLATALLAFYPIWDVLGTIADIRANRNGASKTPQYLNAAISLITSIAVIIALQKGIPQTLIVFGAWAILTGLIQFILGLSRRKVLSGQWPMIISGAQSTIAGVSFIVLAHEPTQGITSLAGYALFGAFYYLLAGFRLNKTKTVSEA